MEMIRVRPSNENRKQFAKWAVTRRAKTISPNEFQVPAKVFSKIPEHLLIGALVNSLPYIPAHIANYRQAVRKTPLIIGDSDDQKSEKEVTNEPVQVSESVISETTNSEVQEPVQQEQESVEEKEVIIEEPVNEEPEVEKIETDDSLSSNEEPKEDEFQPEPEPEPETNQSIKPYCGECDLFFDDSRGLEIHRKFKHRS